MSNDNTAENMSKDGGAEGIPNVVDLQARIGTLEEQVAQYKNEALRHLAEVENTRKRALKERDETAKYAVSKFARDLLDVADNLSRALQAVKPDMLEGNAAIKNLFVGVEATERQMAAVFERAGIQKIDPAGQPFDPNFHRVVSEVETADKPAGTVINVLQVGYMIHDRLLREAMVMVAKGGVASAHAVDQKV